MEIEQVNIVDIQPYENNPRKNDRAVDVVAKSIKEFGFLVPVILDDKNIIVAGHTRVKAAIKLGLTSVPAIYAEGLTQEQIDAFRIMDNKTHEYSDWSFPKLTEELEKLKEKGVDLDLTGFTENELAKLLGTTSEEVPVPDTIKYDIHIEDFYELDNGKGLKHYVYCGDATNKTDVDKLLQGNKIDMVFTDPPYGINIVDKKTNKVGAGNLAENKIYSEVIGDNTTDTAKKSYNLCKGIGIEKMIIWGGNYFVDFLPLSPSWVVWDKRDGMTSNNFADGEMAWCSFKTPVRIFKQLWNGMIREGKKEDKIHPTQKPVQLLSDILVRFSEKKQTILDLFGGSGSTLIACEQTGRNCYMMELDEDYCSKIIERWENLTGKTAKKIQNVTT